MENENINWKETGILDTIDEDDHTLVNDYLNEAVKLITNQEEQLIMLPVIVLRLFKKNKNLNINEIHTTFKNYKQSDEFKKLEKQLSSNIYNIDAESELVALFCDNYEKIKTNYYE